MNFQIVIFVNKNNMITFQRRKQDCLSKVDKSSIGKWDKPILGLCNKLNGLSNYYTLSSCSGRIVLVKNFEKKQPNMFVFRCHTKISFQLLKTKLLEAERRHENIIFKQEPCILHVCCETLKDAETLLEKARFCGWKNSGIMSTQGRIVLELRSTEYLALPIIDSGKLMVDDDFLRVLVAESNNRLLKTWDKIYKLEKRI